MNSEWTSDYAFDQLVKNIDVIQGAAGKNEATTRLRAIDTVIFNILGWDKLKVEAEKYARATGFVDYCFETCGNISLILEAKKDGETFLLPSREFGDKPFGFGLLAEECKSAYEAMVQAAGYATTLGSRYIAISNGHQWLLTLSYVHNQPIDERLVYVFESVDALKTRFQQFWDCFSYQAIYSNNPAIELSESRKSPAPAKLSTTIPGYPLPIDRNFLKNELSYVLSIVWDQLNTNDDSVDFLEKCYIHPDSSEKAFSIAKEIIEKRNKQDELMTGEVLSAKNVSHLVKDYSVEKPILVLGEIGHGKSTFLRYLRLIEAKKELQNYIQINIDFLDNPENAKDVPDFIVKELVRQLAEIYDIEITENKFVRAALNAELNRFKKSPRGQAFPADSNEYRVHELEHIEKFQRDHHEYLTYVFRHIKGSYGKSVAIFFDNLDKRLPDIQEEAFLRSSSMARDWDVLIFVCLRPSTYYSSKRQGVLDSIAPKVISVAPPDTKILLKKRFEYAAMLAGGAINKIPSGKDISVELPTAAKFIAKCCLFSLKHKKLLSLFESISNGNARNLLLYTKQIITSSHLDTKKIMIKIEEEGGYVIADHEAERAILFGDYQHYDPRGAVFINIFDIRHSDPIEHFCKLLCLDSLNRSYASGIQHGYCRLKDIVDYLSQIGYTVDYAKEMIKELLNFKCCRTSTREDKLIDNDVLIGITSLGRYHVNVLTKKFTYVDAVVIDTPIIYETVRSKIHDVSVISERLDRADLFLGYLIDCTNHLQDEDAKTICRKTLSITLRDISFIRRITKRGQIPFSVDREK